VRDAVTGSSTPDAGLDPAVSEATGPAADHGLARAADRWQDATAYPFAPYPFAPADTTTSAATGVPEVMATSVSLAGRAIDHNEPAATVRPSDDGVLATAFANRHGDARRRALGLTTVKLPPGTSPCRRRRLRQVLGGTAATSGAVHRAGRRSVLDRDCR